MRTVESNSTDSQRMCEPFVALCRSDCWKWHKRLFALVFRGRPEFSIATPCDHGVFASAISFARDVWAFASPCATSRSKESDRTPALRPSLAFSVSKTFPERRFRFCRGRPGGPGGPGGPGCRAEAGRVRDSGVARPQKLRRPLEGRLSRDPWPVVGFRFFRSDSVFVSNPYLPAFRFSVRFLSSPGCCPEPGQAPRRDALDLGAGLPGLSQASPFAQPHRSPKALRHPEGGRLTVKP